MDDGCQRKALSNGNSRSEGDLFIKYAYCFIICRHETFMHDSVFHSISKVALQFSSVQSLSRVRLCHPHESQHTRPPCPSPTPGVHSNTSIELVMPSSHLILCRPLFLLPPIPPSIGVFSNESTLCMELLNILQIMVKMYVSCTSFQLFQSCLTLCDPMDCRPTRLVCPWDSPGKNTRVGCHSLLQGSSLTQG